MALTKIQIVEAIQESLNYSKNESTRVVEKLLDIIKENISSGEDVLISGFGKFCVNEKQERKGRNPATDEEMILDKRKVVTFKCSSKLRDKVNN
ncbi:MAG: integration host factor subunit alpha [Desulfobacterales bacterium]|nr:integration host factor subunit alpha [Desulfobacterales bacterium]